MIRLSLSVLGALVVGGMIGRCTTDQPDYTAPAIPVVDSLPPDHWRAEVERLEDLLRDRDGTVDRLRAQLRGLETRAPVVVERVDTLVEVRHVPVILGAVVDRSGRLDLLRASAADSTGLRVPEVARQIDLSRCDDGWALDAGRVVCDTPQFGHLTAFVRAGARYSPDAVEPLGAIGIRWTPYYRATWGIEARATTDHRFEFSGDFGIRLW